MKHTPRSSARLMMANDVFSSVPTLCMNDLSSASLGHGEARAAVARYYAERGLGVEAERVALAASTSEAYGWLFKLCADRGSSVLVPAPSYPLLDLLAELEDVRLVRYPLLREE